MRKTLHSYQDILVVNIFVAHTISSSQTIDSSKLSILVLRSPVIFLLKPFLKLHVIEVIIIIIQDHVCDAFFS